MVDDGLDWTDGEFPYDVVADARRMLAQLEAEADKNPKRRQKINGTRKEGGLCSTLQAALKRPARRSSSDDDDDDDEEDEEESDAEDSESEDNSEDDAEMEDEAASTKDETTRKPKGCVVKQGGTLHGGFTVLMTKIDVSAGAFGMYNFYRMQVQGGPTGQIAGLT